ncbi:MAG: hypothetical protein KDE56_30170, partial [Anaerolineales bacterium]|nr:hypothetical protein [Anaerolineales bacterium]
MGVLIAIFLIALATTLFSMPFVRRLAFGLGFVDAPAQRKLHATPMPLLGGLAIIVGALVGVVLIYGRLPRTILGMLLACLVVA